MPKTKKEFDQVKYKNQFIKERAAAAGESVNEYINQAIKQRMENTSNA